MENKIFDTINDYFTKIIKDNGVGPQGVGSKNNESQILRFKELCKVIDTSTPFSVFDFGCGYGALLDHMEETYPEFKYTGFDICEEMVVNAIESHKGKTNVAWHTQQPENELFDYTIASGIFNVRQDHSDDEWKKYIEDTIMDMNRYSRKGFAFNVLTSYSDVEKRQDYLYYADPLYFFDFCKKNCSKYVTLNHSYPLWEFSILVTKA